MGRATLSFGGDALELDCNRVRGVEEIGRAARFQVEARCAPIDDHTPLVGKPCTLVLRSASRQRVIPLIATQVGVAAQRSGGRRDSSVVLMRLTLEAPWALLRHRTRTRVFQNQSVPEIIFEVLRSAGFLAAQLQSTLTGSYEPERYLVQFQETDLSFVRRLCERSGLYWHGGATPNGAAFVLADDSCATPALEGPVALVGDSGLQVEGDFAWLARLVRRRRPGAIEVANYEEKRPSLALSARAKGGAEQEIQSQFFAVPGGFGSEAAGTAVARRMLEARRAGGMSLELHSSALHLQPGQKVALEPASELSGALLSLAGEYFLTQVRHEYAHGNERYKITASAVPAATPYRLAVETEAPRIYGVHSAQVTGAPGEEIHPEADGSIFVRFFWDRYGPVDQTSSLPVRVAQPNTPGSMVIPRVGWEVVVAFEDGDPDRPYVLGKAYNASHPPPFALPANKTVSALRSFSSPGGQRHNSIHFDDAAGRQHLAINAGFDKSVAVANNRVVQAGQTERKAIEQDQSATIGCDETLSVAQAYFVSAATQSLSVGGTQETYVKGDLKVRTGSETVQVGGALLEQVGDPVQGAVRLLQSAAIEGAFLAGGALGGGVAGKLGAGGIGRFVAGGLAGAAGGAGAVALLGGLGVETGVAPLSQLAEGIASAIPGGGAALAAVSGLGGRLPWEPDDAAEGAVAEGGGAGEAASDDSQAAQAGDGHRVESVEGTYLEQIGGALAVTTPGSILWHTDAAATISVGGLHSISARNYYESVMGVGQERLGSYVVQAREDISRGVGGDFASVVRGNLDAEVGGNLAFESQQAIAVKVGGDMQLSGGKVTFRCGKAELSVSPAGIEICAPEVEFKQESRLDSAATHGSGPSPKQDAMPSRQVEMGTSRAEQVLSGLKAVTQVSHQLPPRSAAQRSQESEAEAPDEGAPSDSPTPAAEPRDSQDRTEQEQPTLSQTGGGGRAGEAQGLAEATPEHGWGGGAEKRALPDAHATGAASTRPASKSPLPPAPEAQTHGLPASLQIPIAARSVEDIEGYVGTVVGNDYNGQALLVVRHGRRVDATAKDAPLWTQHPKAEEYNRRLHPVYEVWVRVDYDGYQRAYDAYQAKKGWHFPPVTDRVLDHVENRKAVGMRGNDFVYVRLQPIDGAVNKSAGNLGGYEQSGKEVVKDMSEDEDGNRTCDSLSSSILYADRADLVKMMNIKPGTIKNGLPGVRKMSDYL